MSVRAIWNGTISFGLVSVPVGLAKAQDRQGVSFRQVHAGCGERITMPKVCPVHGTVEYSEVTRGYETADGVIYEVPEGELEATRPDSSKVIELTGFVNSEAIDPIARDRTYYLMPAKEKAGREGYVLLVEALKRTGRAGLGTFVLWGRENLCTVRSDGDRLLLDLLYYAEDLRDPSPVDSLVRDAIADQGVDVAMVDLASQLIEGQALDFDHSAYFSEYREKLRDMLEALAKGKAPKKAKAKTPPKKDKDLLAALKASVAANTGATPKPVSRRKTAGRSAR